MTHCPLVYAPFVLGQQSPRDATWRTWALVLVGIAAAYIAQRTLADMKKQTNNTEIAANTAQQRR
jgi:hypothetical protein